MTTTDNNAVIRQLEREVELLRDKYRTEQSLRAQEERGRIEAQTQLEHIRRGADMYGVMQSMALQGKKHPKEPHMDGRLDAIRSLVAHNAKLTHELADMQRLYERATRQPMEAERRADRYRPGQAFLMIRRLVDYYWQNTCLHKETHRGGAIWEICSDCGAKWADDEGGRPENETPEVIQDAELLIKMEPNQ